MWGNQSAVLPFLLLQSSTHFTPVHFSAAISASSTSSSQEVKPIKGAHWEKDQLWPFVKQYASPLVWYTDQDLDVDYKKFKNVSFSVNFGKEYYYIKKHLKILFPLQYILKGDELPST